MMSVAKYHVRPLTAADQPFLWEMLYQSLYVPAGSQPFEREILQHPEVAKYVQDWGREHDCGFVAEDGLGRGVGAAWMRLFSGKVKGYGYVDERTPEFAIAVLPEYRGRGIGTRMLSQLLASAEGQYDHVSLSVDIGNPALRLYQRLGFEIIGERDDSLVMKRRMGSGCGERHNPSLKGGSHG